MHQVSSHLRQADALAQLQCAFEMLVDFAQSVEAIDGARADELRAVARETFSSLGEAQGGLMRELERPNAS